MISVVIPLYNKEQSIASTLQSVLAQTCTDYEIIIVDDGSTDNSFEIVRRITGELSNDRVRVIRQTNAGVSAARNAGILTARGEYVAFLDGDDIWDKDFLAEMERLIIDYPGKSIYGLGCRMIYGSDIPADKADTYYRGESRWNWSTMAYTGSSSCVRRDDAIAIGLFDTRMTHGEDIDMWWRLLLTNGGACYQKTYAYYRQDTENRATERLIPLRSFIPFYIEKYSDARSKNPEFRRFFDQEMIHRLYPYLFDKQTRDVAKSLANLLDYSQLKLTLRLRILFPHVYRLLTGR